MKKTKIVIHINGKKEIVNKDLKLINILEIFSIKNQLIAIELNEQIIPKSQYKIKKILNNDRIEILELIGGG